MYRARSTVVSFILKTYCKIPNQRPECQNFLCISRITMPNISGSAVDITHLAEEGHSVNNDVIDLTEEGRGLEVNLKS